MKRTLSIFASTLLGAFVASASAFAAQVDKSPGGFQQVTVVGPSIGFGALDSQRGVIDPPSSIDPGMLLDPPQTGARMPIIRPPGMSNGWLIVPR